MGKRIREGLDVGGIPPGNVRTSFGNILLMQQPWDQLNMKHTFESSFTIPNQTRKHKYFTLE